MLRHLLIIATQMFASKRKKIETINNKALNKLNPILKTHNNKLPIELH